ncbi:MAG: hypothetical protein ACKO5C_00390 [Ferruginibacter sp.]
MKTFFTTVFALCLLGNANIIQAQKMDAQSTSSNAIIPVATFEKALASKTGDRITLTLNEHRFYGIIVSNEVKYKQLQTVVIRSAAKGSNILFQVSRIIQPDNSFLYSGRMIDNERSIVYQIRKNEQAQYTMDETALSSILQDCSHPSTHTTNVIYQ